VIRRLRPEFLIGSGRRATIGKPEIALYVDDIYNGEPSFIDSNFPYLAPERVRATVPDAKLIALLRDPVDRALSHYHHEVALGREPLTFEQAIEAEPERTRGEEERLAREPGYFSHAWWDYAYLARGRYADRDCRVRLTVAEEYVESVVVVVGGTATKVGFPITVNRQDRAELGFRRGGAAA